MMVNVPTFLSVSTLLYLQEVPFNQGNGSSKRSEWCEQKNERRTKWPNANSLISRGSESHCMLLEGTKSCRIQGESVRPYVRTSPPRPLRSWPRPLRHWLRPLRGRPRFLRGWPGHFRGWPTPVRGLGGDMRTDGHIDSPCILQDFVSSGAAALLTPQLPLQNTRAGQGYGWPYLASGWLVRHLYK